MPGSARHRQDYSQGQGNDRQRTQANREKQKGRGPVDMSLPAGLRGRKRATPGKGTKSQAKRLSGLTDHAYGPGALMPYPALPAGARLAATGFHPNPAHQDRQRPHTSRTLAHSASLPARTTPAKPGTAAPAPPDASPRTQNRHRRTSELAHVRGS
jgi:hypothetical protein